MANTSLLKMIITGDIRGLNNELKKGLTGIKDFSKKAGNAFRSTQIHVANLQSAIAAIGVGATIRYLVRARLSIDSIESSFRVAAGSASAGAKEFAFVRSESQRLGLELESTARSYSSFLAAAKGTNLEGKLAQDIFTSVVETMTALGRGSEVTEGALRALEQMVSKGNVQAEELRGQLGERLPGAFQIAARAMGVTTQKLNDMLDRGEVLAEDLLPKLARELHATFGEQAAARSGGLQAELNRLKTAIFEIATSPDLNGFTDSLRDLRETLQDPQIREGLNSLLQGLVKVSEVTVKSGTVFSHIAQGLGIRAGQILNPQLDDEIRQVRNEIEALQKQSNAAPGFLKSAFSFVGIETVDDKIANLNVRLETLLAQQRELNSFTQSPAGQTATEEQPFAPDVPGAGGGSSADEKAQEKIAAFVQALKDEQVAIGATTSELIRYELEKLGANDATILHAQAIAMETQVRQTAADVAVQQTEREQELLDARYESMMADQDLINQLSQLIELERMDGVEKEQTIALAKLSAEATDEQRAAVAQLAAELYELEQSQKNSNDAMKQFADQAARNMQDTLADFLFDPFDKGLDGMVKGFADAMRRMVAEAAAAQILKTVFPEGAGSFFSSFFHSGGIAGSGSGRHSVNPMAFIGAPKYHGGGVAGLASNETPAILELGEEILTRQDPRHRFNGGGQGDMNLSLNLIDDPDRIGQTLAGPAGEKALTVMISRNPAKFRKLLQVN